MGQEKKLDSIRTQRRDLLHLGQSFNLLGLQLAVQNW